MKSKKWCSGCEKFKKLTEFWNNKKTSDGKQTYCKKCLSQKFTAYQRRRLTGCTPEQYKELTKTQKGVCAICGKNGTRRLSADHDHKTGQIRGLLCTRCNLGLGMFDDNPKLLTAAINYIRIRKS